MANRPATLCELEKGKLIDTQKGFTDTFNFAVRAIDNLEGGKNCEVDWTIPDHPVINVDIPETEGSVGGGGGNVEDVTSETYQGGESIKVEYLDGSADGHIPLSFVKDVSSETYQSKPAIKVEYSDGSQDAHIMLPESGGNVDNVTSETYNNGESIKVEYADGSTATHIPLSFVKDVSSETHQGGESILVEHSDGSQDAHIPLSFVKDVTSSTYQGSPAIKVTHSDGSADTNIQLPSGGHVDDVRVATLQYDTYLYVDLTDGTTNSYGIAHPAANVKNVSKSTSQDGSQQVKVEYANGLPDSEFTLSFVKDVTRTNYQDSPALKIEYNGDQPKYVTLPDSGGNVDNVTSETYNNGESIKVEYADGSSDTHIPLSFVKDVSSETYQSGESIKVEYSDGSQDAHIPLSFVKDVSSETYQSKPAIKVEYSDGSAAGYITLPTVNTDTVDVITDISFDFDNNNQLVATLTKKRVTVIDKSDLSNGTAGLKLWKYNVVISSSYSTQNHQFKNKVTSGVVTNQTIDTSTSQDSSPVFTSTAHSNE